MRSPEYEDRRLDGERYPKNSGSHSEVGNQNGRWSFHQDFGKRLQSSHYLIADHEKRKAEGSFGIGKANIEKYVGKEGLKQ